MSAPSRRCRPCARAPGYSLMEALACVALMTALASPAAAAFGGLFDRVQVHAAVSGLRAAIQAARLYAMQRAERIDVLPVSAGNWAQGWHVLIDANNNQRADPGEPVLHVHRRPAGALRVTAALTDSTRAYLAFGAGGRPRTASSPNQPQFGSFLFTHGSERRKLVIGFLGRVRICDPDRDGPSC